MDEVLFEIKKENLETGLRGYPVGYCTTSTVDPQKGLFYAGHPVSEMDHMEPEQVIFLLYYGRIGSREEVLTFSKELQQRSLLSPALAHHIRGLPREAHPMKLFAAALLIAQSFEGRNQYREDCLNIIAKIPEIAALVIHHHAGWGEINPTSPQMGYMQNFTQMLKVPNGNYEQLSFAFKLFNILHYDHGGGNLSAFVGKAVASGLEDLYGAMAAAMCALAGSRHGKANQDGLLFVRELLSELGSDVTEEAMEAYLRKKLASGALIFGFGHAVLRSEDPRASLLYDLTGKLYADHPLVRAAHLLRKVGPKVLKDNPKISNPYPNVDAISGVMLSAAGFSYPIYYTVLFGMARVIGISRQIVYEREEAREGKGTPIVRPKYFYKAPV